MMTQNALLKSICTFLMFLLAVSCSMAQQNLSGKIVDENNDPMIGANIIAKGTTIGTIADIDGNFQLKVPEGVNSIIVSYTGFLQQEIDVTGKTNIEVTLLEDAGILDEVVVIGYGRQKKSVVTGAVSSVDVTSLASRSVGQLESGIQGTIAGLRITPNSGAPDAGFKIFIRGIGSNGPSNPLYIVDGMRTRDVSWLESAAIDRFEVLKDAASASIYGAEGANGVVLISTKNGVNSSGLTYNVQYGNQSYRGNLDVFDANQYLDYLNFGKEADDSTRYVGQGANTNWIDEVFQAAPVMRHNISFSGGDEKLSYYFGGSYFDQAGILGGKDISRFKRLSGNLGLASQLNDKIKVGVNLTYANENSKGSSAFGDQSVGSFISNTILMDPTTPVTYDEARSNEVIEQFGDNGSFLLTDDEGRVYGVSENLTGENINPFVNLAQINGDGNTNSTLFASAFGTLDIIDGLSLTSRVGVESTNGSFHNWSPAYYYSPERSALTPSSAYNKFDGLGVQWENFLSYDLDLTEDIGLSLLAGTSIYSNTSRFLNAFAGGLVAATAEVSFADGSEADTDIVGGKVDQKLQSYFGRANFNIQDKYLLMASIRRDGTSLFTDGNRFKTYPGISLGWVVSRENFLDNTGFLSFLKLRASWGQAGSLSGVTPGAGQPNIGFNYVYSDADGGFITIGETGELGNPDLTWETGEQTNIGLDFGFMADRLSLSVDYFNRLTRDLITISSAPVFIGNSAPLINAGTMSNKGLEFEAGYKNRDNALKYQVSANLTTIKNEVTEVNNGLSSIPGNALVGTSWFPTVFEEGQPAWYFRGYETNGVDENGELVIVDQPNEEGVTDGIISEDDQVYIGDPHPNLLYGAAVNLEYNNFDFTLFVQGQSGNDILVGYLRDDRVTYNRPTFFNEADYFGSVLPSGDGLKSDKMIHNGAFTRVKQIQLGYNFENFINGVNNFRVYASLEDYFTFTKYNGLEVEVGSTANDAIGVDRGIYPIPGRILFGASINF